MNERGNWIRHNSGLVALGLVTALCLLSMSVAIAFRAHDQAQINDLVHQNAERIADISLLAREEKQTNDVLCTAVLGARHFWIGVRATTLEILSDPSLSPGARRSNEHYVTKLNAVIRAAGALGKRCHQ